MGVQWLHGGVSADAALWPGHAAIQFGKMTVAPASGEKGDPSQAALVQKAMKSKTMMHWMSEYGAATALDHGQQIAAGKADTKFEAVAADTGVEESLVGVSASGSCSAKDSVVTPRKNPVLKRGKSGKLVHDSPASKWGETSSACDDLAAPTLVAGIDDLASQPDTILETGGRDKSI